MRIIKRKFCFRLHLRTGLQRRWWETCWKQRGRVGVRESRICFPSPRKGASFLPHKSRPPLALLLLNCSPTNLQFSAHQWASSSQRQEWYHCWELSSGLEPIFLYSIIQGKKPNPQQEERESLQFHYSTATLWGFVCLNMQSKIYSSCIQTQKYLLQYHKLMTIPHQNVHPQLNSYQGCSDLGCQLIEERDGITLWASRP